MLSKSLELKEHDIFGSAPLGVKSVIKMEIDGYSGSVSIPGSGIYSISYIPTTSLVTLKIIRTSSAPTTYIADIKGIYTDSIVSFSTIPVVTTICSEDKYEYGFNGQMKVNEIAGIGNHNTSLYGEFDTRNGRRWNLDPKPNASVSEYSTFMNNPVLNEDPKGDIIIFGKSTTKQFRNDFNSAAINLLKHGQVQQLRQLMLSPKVYIMQEYQGTNSNFSNNGSNGGTIEWNPTNAIETDNGTILSPTTILSHEMGHAVDYDNNMNKYIHDATTDDNEYDKVEERNVITGVEQQTANALGETKDGKVTRKNHNVKTNIIVASPTSTNGTPVPQSATLPPVTISAKKNEEDKEKDKTKKPPNSAEPPKPAPKKEGEQ